MVDDDVYMMKNNKLPVGESLNDETSYASYRNNRDNRTVSSSFYDDEFLARDRFHRDIWMFSMGFGNPYYNNWMFGSRPNWGFPYDSPYMYGYVNPLYLYDPFGSPYGFYPTAYNPWYMGGNYGYGFNGGYYGYGNGAGYTFNNSGNTYTSYNHHSGPRGTTAGFGNPSNRLQGNTVKSINSNLNEVSSYNNRTSIQPKVDNNTVIGDNYKPTGNNFSRGGSVFSKPEVSYKPTSDRGIRNPSTINSGEIRGNHPSQSPQRTIEMRNNGGGRIDSPSRSNSGNSPSNGNGRSGGSPSNTGGRRN
jgi:hypothetical protein